MTALQAVLFDLGDTLVDLGEGRGDYEARLAVRGTHVFDALAALGAPVADREGFAAALARDSEAQYLAATAELRGIDIYAVMRWFLPRRGVPAEETWVLAAGEAFYAGAADGPGLRPSARELLDTLRSLGLRLGVISNTLAPGPFMDRSLVRRGLMEFFPVRIYSSDVGVAKPHPAIFRAALEAIGTAPGQALYVGDRLQADVAGAQAVGMKGILIEVAHRVEDDPAIQPDARIVELPELLGVLPALLPGSQPG
jgi:putative hydrolase of the HAD superfamily